MGPWDLEMLAGGETLALRSILCYPEQVSGLLPGCCYLSCVLRPRDCRAVREGDPPRPGKLSVPTLPASADNKKEGWGSRYLCLV